MNPQKKFVLFDFDGVIADSYDVAFSVSKTICSRITDEEYRRAFMGNVNDWDWTSIPHEKGDTCKHDLEWFGEYIPRFEQEARPFPGIKEQLEALSKEYILIIISSTISSPIQGFLEKYHLGRYFSEVMGNDVHTHKTEKIKMVFNTYKASAPECVFVTDSLGDLREAATMSVGAIGVTWGWHSREILDDGKPFRVIDTMNDLHPAVSDYFRANS